MLYRKMKKKTVQQQLDNTLYQINDIELWYKLPKIISKNLKKNKNFWLNLAAWNSAKLLIHSSI